MADNDLNVVGTTSKPGGNKPNFKIIGAIVGIVVLALGVVAGILLVRQQQDIREKAAVKQCPQDEECPVSRDPTHLWSCTPGEADGSVDDMVCSTAGRIGVCGGRQYCCPSVGAAWTTNLSLCPQKTASPTAAAAAASVSTATATATSTSASTSTPTGSGTKTATPTASATSTSTSAAVSTATATGSTSTPFPVPETGASWPSIVGVGAGIIILIFSLGLAL